MMEGLFIESQCHLVVKFSLCLVFVYCSKAMMKFQQILFSPGFYNILNRKHILKKNSSISEK